MYVAFLEVAPWNKQGSPVGTYERLGTALLRIAAEVSLKRGCRGRVDLRSVAAAESFYRQLGFHAHDCPSEYNELYFELDESGVAALLAGPGDCR
jgi:hypothetical protein